MKVSVKELRLAAERLFSHLEETGNTEVQIESDFYWDVPAEGRYDSYSQPLEFSVGQLSSDIDEVRRLAHGDAEVVNLGLVWLSSIIRCIGEMTPD